jgi:UDP-N-acetylglucosamine transferase subunit ALG13
VPAFPPSSVFVTVGTDHHRFDRLVDWVEQWAHRNPSRPLVVQHGHSRPPTTGLAAAMLTIDDMRAAFGASVVVVCGGGPGTVMDARAAGRLPIVVPRRPELDEVVDDHQRDFCARLAVAGKALVADDSATLHRLLDEATATPGRFRIDPRDQPVPEGVRRIPALIDGLLGRAGVAPVPTLTAPTRRTA